MAGLSDTGFEIIRLPEIIEEHNTDAQEIFADLAPVGETVDVSGDATLGRLIAVISPSEAVIWETMQQIYDAFTVAGASGIPLDNLVALSGISRLPASPSRSYVLLSGLPGTVVPAGTQFNATAFNASYTLDLPVTLDATKATGIDVAALTLTPTVPYSITVAWSESGTSTFTIMSSAVPTQLNISTQLKAAIDADPLSHLTATVQTDGTLRLAGSGGLETASFSVSDQLSIRQTTSVGQTRSLEDGPTIILAGTLTGIPVPVNGLYSVTNPLDSSPGRLQETDEELRIRFRGSKFQLGTNIIEALYSELISVVGVKQVVIYENDTDVMNSQGVLPHSFIVLINGGFADDIAHAIWNNRPTGIRSQGEIAVDILDKYNIVRTIHYSRPQAVDVYITMDIEQTSLFPQDGQEQIKANLVAHFESATMGSEVLYSRLYTPINSVPGHYINSLFIGTAANPTGTGNLTIPYNAVARLLPQNIIFT